MATDFDSNAIVTTGGIKPSCVDTPADMRTRIELLEDMESIPLPYIGMIVYCKETDAYYKITGLKAKEIGSSIIENAVIESYEKIEFHTIGNEMDMDNYMLKDNPIGVGAFSMNRLKGDYTKKTGEYSSTLGFECVASGKYSHAEGYQSEATLSYAHAEGQSTSAKGNASHAEGSDTAAVESWSHAEGYHTYSSGQASHAEGCFTQANGHNSHAEGQYSEANGGSSHAEGYHTVANGEDSHAEGCYTIATGNKQHVNGAYNIEDTEGRYINIIGNGTNAKRSNAHTVDWNGNAWYAGNVYIGGASQDDAVKLATENQINELMAIIESLQARIEELENPNINTEPKPKHEYIKFSDDDCRYYQLSDYDSEIDIYKAWTFEMVYTYVITNCDNIHVSIKDEESHILEATLIDDFVSDENDEKIYLLRIKPKSDGICTLKISNEDGSCETNVVLIYLEPNEEITHNITYDFEGISLADLSEYGIDNKLIDSCTHGQHIMIGSDYRIVHLTDENNVQYHQLEVGVYGYQHCAGHTSIAIDPDYKNYYFKEHKLYICGYEITRNMSKYSYDIEAFGDVHIVYKIGNLDEL